MTRKEFFEEHVGRPMMDRANERMVDRLADAICDLRLEYVTGKISQAEFDQRYKSMKDRIAEMYQIEEV